MNPRIKKPPVASNITRYNGVISPRQIIRFAESYTGVSHRNITECNISQAKAILLLEQGVRNAIDKLIGLQKPEDIFRADINELSRLIITDVKSIDNFCIKSFENHYQYLKKKYGSIHESCNRE
jgi:hypothetical protein